MLGILFFAYFCGVVFNIIQASVAPYIQSIAEVS
jgi:hypothetical protein